jgi:cytochrome c oxidase subunit IV
MVWESIVFVGAIILIPILVAAFVGGRGEKKSSDKAQDGKGA